MRLHIRALLRQSVILTRGTRRRFAQVDFEIAFAAQPFEQWIDRTFRDVDLAPDGVRQLIAVLVALLYKSQHPKLQHTFFELCVHNALLSGGARRLFLKAEPAVHGLPLLCTGSCMTWVSQRRRFPHGFCRKPRKRERGRACADFCKLHAARGLRSSRAAPLAPANVRAPAAAVSKDSACCRFLAAAQIPCTACRAARTGRRFLWGSTSRRPSSTASMRSAFG